MRGQTAQAYTLVELLIVIAIIGALFLITLSLGGRSREAFTATQQTKEILQEIRSARRRSMLVTKLPTETWVHAVGVEFQEDSATFKWSYRYVKLQHVNNAEVLNYYIPYPKPNKISNLTYVFREINTFLPINNDGVITFFKNNGTPIGKCNKRIVRIMFESINGTPHIYCGTEEWEKDITLGLTGTHYRIKLTTDGDISSVIAQ